ncbi:formate/nitrite transporter family protein [Sphingomonas spermidinifaciens]|uniref:Formate/nitrite transporter family protein n=1 Tax=Sphingomonas spermidinifaciens TaxID=1141889 RepID=A0A2A4B316_9SPHN|nr:formate/nitrite transporter family protein [Sphingomonas spermidinifaciens]PCD02480.1 formate/nitrite transporter family protein [Sphingomonas spermidinifaciens]
MSEDLTGAEIAETAPDVFEAKAEAPPHRMALLAVLAGMFIAFGSIAYLVAQASGPPSGTTQLLSGLAFSVGLILVTVTGAELFTGNTMFVLAAETGELGAARMLAAWVIVWLGNLVGSVIVAALFVAAGGGAGIEGAVADAALSTAATKTGKTTLALVSSAVLANMLVCLAVWMAIGGKSLPAKILAIIGPVTVFVAAGLEHSIANQSLLAIGWLIQSDGAIGLAAIGRNLGLTTLGNIVGGMAVALALGHAQLKSPAG